MLIVQLLEFFFFINSSFAFFQHNFNALFLYRPSLSPWLNLYCALKRLSNNYLRVFSLDNFNAAVEMVFADCLSVLLLRVNV